MADGERPLQTSGLILPSGSSRWGRKRILDLLYHILLSSRHRDLTHSKMVTLFATLAEGAVG